MEENEAASILEALGAGCHPATGEVLEPESVLQDPQVLKALFVAVQRLRSSSRMDTSPVPQKSVVEPIEEEVNVHQLAHRIFRCDFVGGPKRFKKPGWIDVGPAEARCPNCSLRLRGLRKPYNSSGRVFHYWALLCQRCRIAIPPSELEVEEKLELYASSDLRPGAKD